MSSGRPPSALAIFGFLLSRTTANLILRRLKRIREPRYVIGVLIGAAYFYAAVFRPMTRGAGRHAGIPTAPSEEAAALFLLGASLILAVVAILSWLFFKGTPHLDLKEADVQFLVPAPLTSRAVVHFSLLRSQLGLAFSSVIVAYFFGRGISPHAWQRVGANWILFSTLSLHGMGLAFSKASWDEMPPERRRGLRIGTSLLAVLFAGVLLMWVVDGARLLVTAMSGADTSAFRSTMEAIASTSASTEVAAWLHGFVPRVLLAPFMALLSPAFAPDAASFFWTLPAALGLFLFHYLWVVRVSGRYEEAALAGAQRNAERALRRDRGQVTGPAAPSRRDVVPFPLRANGIPELAIVWKNLLSRGRFRLRTTSILLALLWLALFIACAAGAGSPAGTALSLSVAAMFAVVAPLFTLTLPIGLRIDLRSDLERVTVLRAWPISATRLVAAEILTPLIVTMIWVWGALGSLIAVLAGRHWALVRMENAGLGPSSTFGGATGTVFANFGIPATIGLALFLPSVAAAALVIQNGAVLAWPDWFPPGQKRARGFEATGSRVLSMFGTTFIAVVGLIPAAIVGAIAFTLGSMLIGPWALVPAGLLASVPVWAEAYAGVLLLGRLFDDFDVSKETIE